MKILIIFCSIIVFSLLVIPPVCQAEWGYKSETQKERGHEPEESNGLEWGYEKGQDGWDQDESTGLEWGYESGKDDWECNDKDWTDE